jgi:hypothetical protein
VHALQVFDGDFGIPEARIVERVIFGGLRERMGDG